MKTILIIDDDLIIAKALANLLCDLYVVLVITDCPAEKPEIASVAFFSPEEGSYIQKAKDIVRGIDTHVIITDGVLGSECGMDLVGQILISQEITNKPGFVLITGNYDMINFQGAYAKYLPLRSYLSKILLKPINRSGIIDAIEKSFRPATFQFAPPADLLRCLQDESRIFLPRV